MSARDHGATCGVHFGSVGCTCGVLIKAAGDALLVAPTREALKPITDLLRGDPNQQGKGKTSIGIGAPAWFALNEFGRVLRDTFDNTSAVYLVGSAARGKEWRDVDVRVVLPVDDFERLCDTFTNMNRPLTRWAAMCRAFSTLGREMTGLPIDFQVQLAEHVEQWRHETRWQLGIKRQPSDLGAALASLEDADTKGGTT